MSLQPKQLNEPAIFLFCTLVLFLLCQNVFCEKGLILKEVICQYYDPKMDPQWMAYLRCPVVKVLDITETWKWVEGVFLNVNVKLRHHYGDYCDPWIGYLMLSHLPRERWTQAVLLKSSKHKQKPDSCREVRTTLQERHLRSSVWKM